MKAKTLKHLDELIEGRAERILELAGRPSGASSDGAAAAYATIQILAGERRSLEEVRAWIDSNWSEDEAVEAMAGKVAGDVAGPAVRPRAVCVDKVVELTCKGCGKSFQSSDKRRKFCSDKCRQDYFNRVYEARKSEARKARKAKLQEETVAEVKPLKPGPLPSAEIYEDEYGFRTHWERDMGVPVVDEGRISLDKLLSQAPNGDGLSIRRVCHLPKAKRGEYSVNWTLSEYGAACRLMEAEGLAKSRGVTVSEAMRQMTEGGAE